MQPSAPRLLTTACRSRWPAAHNPWLVAVVVSMATFMEVLDTSIANVSLRHIAGSLAASLDESTWVLTSYLVANAIVLPICGWLATVIGRKRFYMGCVALFTVSSVLCGLAPSLTWLIVFRVLQGFGGGGLAPSEQSILADSFPPAKRGMAFALYGVAVVVAPAVGPTLGGWITDNYSWHWIFFINLPVGIVSLALSYLRAGRAAGRNRSTAKSCWPAGCGSITSASAWWPSGLGACRSCSTKASATTGSARTSSSRFASISALALMALVVWELTHDDPIVDLPLLGNRGFAASVLLMFAHGIHPLRHHATAAADGARGLGLHRHRGRTGDYARRLRRDGDDAGRRTAAEKVQARNLIALGLIDRSGRAVPHERPEPAGRLRRRRLGRVFQAAGIAFLFVPISTVAYLSLPAGKNNSASALVNLARNLGGSFGISLAKPGWPAAASSIRPGWSAI